MAWAVEAMSTFVDSEGHESGLDCGINLQAAQIGSRFSIYYFSVHKSEKSVPLKISIRPETAADIAAIEKVTTSAFLNAPHTSHTEQFIVNALRKAGKLTLALVAEFEGAVVGHVAVSPVSISDGTTGWFGLGPISVTPEHQGRGVGSQLMREALRILRERGAGGCVLVGEPAYYGRFGFRADPNLVLPGVPPEYFQAVSFKSSQPRGVVSYDAALDARD